MRAVVFAYHEIGYVCLEELLAFGVDVPGLFTHADDPHEEIWFRRPAELAGNLNISVHTSQNLNDPATIRMISDMRPDVIFSFYYRHMIPQDILSIPTIGAFNLHGSLLPKFRGRCPVNWVLIMGEKRTGLTLHAMVEKPDAGDIVSQRTLDIAFDDTAYTLFMKMAREARILMKEILPRIQDKSFTRIPQADLGPSTYFGGRSPEDGLIVWQKDAVSLYNLTRAVTHPYPGAYTYLEGRKFFVWQAYPEEGQDKSPPGSVISAKPLVVSTGKGKLRLLSVQLEDENEMDGEAFAATHSIDKKTFGGNT